MTRVGSGVWALALVSALGCGDAGGGGSQRAGAGPGTAVGGTVVSTVDGHAIQLAAVADVARDTGLSGREALRRLQAEQLLMQEAARRGEFEGQPEVQDVARRAAVQALLDAEAASVQVPEDDVREAYAAQRARFETKEQRRVLHLYASVREGVSADVDARARAYVASVLPELRATTDPAAFAQAYSGRVVDGIKIAAELLPPLAREGRVVAPFEDAMFSLPVPGVVPEPVRTMYGWHAIRVLEITPASAVPYETAAATLRKELETERRKKHVEELMVTLRKRYHVVIAPNAQALLTQLEL